MKKFVPVFACLLAAMISCDFAIPTSVTIKGSPEFYLPIGSLFSLFPDNNPMDELKKYISKDQITGMLDDNTNIRVFDYEGPFDFKVAEGVQAYLIHYPITEMDMNLSNYINNAMFEADEAAISVEISEVDGLDLGPAFLIRYPQGVYLFNQNGDVGWDEDDRDLPLFVVNLIDMKKLLIKVEGEEFGIEFDYNDDLKNALRIRIPALGIVNYIEGKKEETDEGTKLRFISTAKEFNPSTALKDDPKTTDVIEGNLEIFVKIEAPCSGKIAPEMVFDWISAVVNTTETGDGDLSDNIPVPAGINSLSELLEGMTLKNVKGYVFVGGLENDTVAKMSLKFDGQSLFEDGEEYHLLTGVEGHPFVDNDGSRPVTIIPKYSLDPVDLRSIFNAGDDSSLAYNIQIEKMEITKASLATGGSGKPIFADFVILIPLELEVSTPSGVDGYVKFNLLNVNTGNGEGDLLGRTGSENDLLNNIDYLQINFTDYKNDIFDASLAIHIFDDNEVNKGTAKYKPYSKWLYFKDIESGVKPYINIEYDELPFPFNPNFEILLTVDENSNPPSSTVSIKRMGDDPQFDFKVSIQVKTDLNLPISLGSQE